MEDRAVVAYISDLIYTKAKILMVLKNIIYIFLPLSKKSLEVVLLQGKFENFY